MVTNAPASDRLIVALDVKTSKHAIDLVDRLDGQVNFFKVGLELFAGGTGHKLIETLSKRGHKIFADFKFFDIPATVSRSVRNLDGLGITFLTVHGDNHIVEAAVRSTNEISILAVTVLTSIDQVSLKDMGINRELSSLVTMRAVNSYQAGCAGVIASAREATHIREKTGSDFLIVTPGIRNEGSTANDQRRTMSAKSAIESGADYLVVGRPIRDADNPARAAAQFQSEIAEALSANSVG